MISYNNRSDCEAARLCFYDLLDAESETNVPEDVRIHISACRYCQADMNRLEALLADTGKAGESKQSSRDSAIATLLSLHFAWADKPVTCKSVKPFLPSLADPLLQITIPTPITVHVDNCRKCSDELSNIDSMGLTHKELCRLGQEIAKASCDDVADQGDSGIATRFTFPEFDDESTDTKSDRRYADWPISVQVLERAANRGDGTTGPSQRRERASVISLKQYLKPAIAAAAVILIGFAMFFTAPAAKAVDLDQIYSALMRARNIHIANFLGDRTEPERERWVSRSLNAYLLKIGQERTLWDFRDGVKKIVSFPDVPPKAVAFTKAAAAAARGMIESPLNIVPFESVSKVPGGKWIRVTDEVFPSGAGDREVYDLTWTETKRGIKKHKKWRVFVESGTNRPRKAQFSEKATADAAYDLQNELVIEYLTDQEVEAAIEQAQL